MNAKTANMPATYKTKNYNIMKNVIQTGITLPLIRSHIRCVDYCDRRRLFNIQTGAYSTVDNQTVINEFWDKFYREIEAKGIQIKLGQGYQIIE